MVASDPPNAEPPNPSQKSIFRGFKSDPSNTDWLGPSILTARTVAAAAEFPYVKGVFGTVVVILETIEVWLCQLPIKYH
jgi:hypothetical protein